MAPGKTANTRALSARAMDKEGHDVGLQRFRTLMKEREMDAYVVPTADPHQSEYPPNCHARREYLTKFTGSAGSAVVTEDEALLWTDGRYFLQAADELGEDWGLQKQGVQGTPTISEWLSDKLKPGSNVAIDPYLHTALEVEQIEKKLAEKNINLQLVHDNLVDALWDTRPPFPTTPIRIHPPEWAGKTSTEKLAELRADMDKENADVMVLSKLDDVAWALNLRGGDIESNPVFLSYLLVLKDKVMLFVDKSKVTPTVQQHLDEIKAEVEDYDNVVGAVEDLAKAGMKIMYDPASTSVALAHAAKASPEVVRTTSPIDLKKALKNKQELDGMREAHLRDAAALCKFWAWMDLATKRGEVINEYDAGGELKNFRSEQPGFIEPSFPSIVGEGPNGAVIHYRAAKATARDIKAGSLILIDSGGQYDCGTTDVTRVYHFGGDKHQPTQEQKDVYTRVLKGHIAVDTAVFPEGTPGFVLDVFARRHLWEAGLNYLHGTGHGVGAALNVHEGPHSISPRFTNTVPLKPGMICSNEPGYYEDGVYGMRIENLLIVTEKETPNTFNDVKYLGFERLTHVPIQRKLLNLDLMTDDEIKWMNDYHNEIWEKISPRVSDEQAALDWLFDNTQPIKREPLRVIGNKEAVAAAE